MLALPVMNSLDVSSSYLNSWDKVVLHMAVSHEEPLKYDLLSLQNINNLL